MKITSLTQLPRTPVSHNPEIVKKVLLEKGAVPGLLQFAQATLTPGQKASVHAHETAFEVFLVESGQGEIIVNAIPYHLAAGTCVTVEPNELHGLENTGKANLVLTLFKIEALSMNAQQAADRREFS